MTDFDRILHSIESAEAEAIASRTVGAASADAARSLKVAEVRKRFEALGIAAYLQEQAAAMQAQGFHAEVDACEIPDRAHVSLDFVPVRGEAYHNDHSFGDNACSLVILGFADGEVEAIMTARNARDTSIPRVAVAELTLAHVQNWFQQLVHFGLNYAKEREAGRAPRT
ncbi:MULTISPECIES: hypothetical protein [Cupriavidus]